MSCTPRSRIFRTLWSNISPKIEKEFENTLDCLWGAQMGSNHTNKWRSKISWHTPFKVPKGAVFIRVRSPRHYESLVTCHRDTMNRLLQVPGTLWIACYRSPWHHEPLVTCPWDTMSRLLHSPGTLWTACYRSPGHYQPLVTCPRDTINRLLQVPGTLWTACYRSTGHYEPLVTGPRDTMSRLLQVCEHYEPLVTVPQDTMNCLLQVPGTLLTAGGSTRCGSSSIPRLAGPSTCPPILRTKQERWETGNCFCV